MIDEETPVFIAISRVRHRRKSPNPRLTRGSEPLFSSCSGSRVAAPRAMFFLPCRNVDSVDVTLISEGNDTLRAGDLPTTKRKKRIGLMPRSHSRIRLEGLFSLPEF